MYVCVCVRACVCVCVGVCVCVCVYTHLHFGQIPTFWLIKIHLEAIFRIGPFWTFVPSFCIHTILSDIFKSILHYPTFNDVKNVFNNNTLHLCLQILYLVKAVCTYFEIFKADNLIPARRPYLVSIKKKKQTYRQVDFAVPVDWMVKIEKKAER